MKSLLVCLMGLLVSVQANPVSPPMVSGQVRLADGSPVAGARVVLFDLADLHRGPVSYTLTDAAGQFVLRGVARGPRPHGVGLGQNYPNPFNPATLIPYQLAAPSRVRLEVFNVLGHPVATLVEGEQGPGNMWRGGMGRIRSPVGRLYPPPSPLDAALHRAFRREQGRMVGHGQVQPHQAQKRGDQAFGLA